ncbi:MAG TPA: hypothetical protein VHL57_05950, partial [Flavobacteriales bacterium]|nr:hypothetical protein [Flavobacteriales bacterium]
MIDPDNFIMVRAARAKRYSPVGDPLDEVTYQAAQVDTIGFLGLPGMDVDANNGIALTLHTFYTSQGAKTTTAHFAQGTTDPDWVKEVHDPLGARTRMLYGYADGLGNSICTGDFLTFTPEFNTTRIVVKHNASGTIAWERRYDTAVDGPAAGIATAVGHDGSVRVYLVPEDDFSGDPLTLRVLKLDPDGNQLWEAQKALAQPAVYSVVTDVLGNTFLCGAALPDGSPNNAFVVVKFDPDGNEAWTTFHAVAGATSHVGGTALATGDGGVLLPGSAGIGGWTSSDMDFTLTRFNADGTVAWSTPVNVVDGSGGAVEAVVDDAGNIYATGAVQDQNTGEYDFLTAKFSSDGTLDWSDRLGDATHDERTYSLKVLSTGDVVVVGYKLALDETLNNVLVRYDQDGSIAWTTLSPEAFFYRDFCVDADDNSYIMDQVEGTTFPYRLFNGLVYSTAAVLEVDAAGNIQAEEHHTGPELSEFFPERMFAHNDGRLTLAGSLMNENFYEGIYLFDTDLELPTSVTEVENDRTHSGAAYPNPFNERTSIPLTLATAARVRLDVFDAQGRVVKQLPERMLPAGTHTLAIDA